MSNTTVFLDRNRQFASDFTAADPPGLPRLRTAVLTCAVPRVDPAHNCRPMPTASAAEE